MPEEMWLMIILILGWTTSIVVEIQCTKWHRKHDEAVDMWTIESRRKDKQLEKLEKELKTYKDNEHVIKIEKLIMQPRELECKFALHERFIEDTELFKKIITTEVARYMAEELNRDPYLCKIFHEKNAFTTQEHIKVRFRMLPYSEEVTWNDILKEELRGDIHD